MRKKERKRLRRWYFEHWSFAAVTRYFLQRAKRKMAIPLARAGDGNAMAKFLEHHARFFSFGEAQQEAYFWYFGLTHRNLRVKCPSKGKVSARTIQVIKEPRTDSSMFMDRITFYSHERRVYYNN